VLGRDSADTIEDMMSARDQVTKGKWMEELADDHLDAVSGGVVRRPKPGAYRDPPPFSPDYSSSVSTLLANFPTI